MIEITFTESAGGGLKMAQSFGKGKYRKGCVGVILHHEDGSEPTPEEIEAAQREAELHHQQEWEQAIPLGGKAGDVYCFSQGLALGDIRDPLCIPDRLSALKVLFSFWNEQIEQDMRKQLEKISPQLDEIRSRISKGEDARIWYSNIPDELCGFYWLMDELRSLPEGHGTIYGLKQPQFEEKANSVVSYKGWGEVEPGHFGAFVHLAVPVSDQMRRVYGNMWKELQRENTLLRACIDGRLRSAPENLYDHYIRMELENEPEEFKEARLVGNVLGKYELAVGDGYIHYRIEKLVEAGELIPVTKAKDGEPGYWRTLRKQL